MNILKSALRPTQGQSNDEIAKEEENLSKENINNKNDINNQDENILTEEDNKIKYKNNKEEGNIIKEDNKNISKKIINKEETIKISTITSFITNTVPPSSTIICDRIVAPFLASLGYTPKHEIPSLRRIRSLSSFPAQSTLGLSHYLSRCKVEYDIGRQDVSVIQCYEMLEVVCSDIVRYGNKMREMYSYHFPELVDIVRDFEIYVLAVSCLLNVNDGLEEKLAVLRERINCEYNNIKELLINCDENINQKNNKEANAEYNNENINIENNENNRKNNNENINIENNENNIKNNQGNIDIEDIENIISKIKSAVPLSIGIKISQNDLLNIQKICIIILQKIHIKKSLTAYLKTSTSKVAPNLTALLSPRLTANLLSKAGGLSNLAKCPSSTLQVLGAEKALFRALKAKTDTPKYGVLFEGVKHVDARDRGRLARFVASKAVIAARIDCYGEGRGSEYGDAMRDLVDRKVLSLRDGSVVEHTDVVLKRVFDRLKKEGALREKKSRRDSEACLAGKESRKKGKMAVTEMKNNLQGLNEMHRKDINKENTICTETESENKRSDKRIEESYSIETRDIITESVSSRKENTFNLENKHIKNNKNLDFNEEFSPDSFMKLSSPDFDSESQNLLKNKDAFIPMQRKDKNKKISKKEEKKDEETGKENNKIKGKNREKVMGKIGEKVEKDNKKVEGSGENIKVKGRKKEKEDTDAVKENKNLKEKSVKRPADEGESVSKKIKGDENNKKGNKKNKSEQSEITINEETKKKSKNSKVEKEIKKDENKETRKKPKKLKIGKDLETEEAGEKEANNKVKKTKIDKEIKNEKIKDDKKKSDKIKQTKTNKEEEAEIKPITKKEKTTL